MVAISTVAQYLRGLDFPCSTQDCIEHARTNNAPDEVIDFLGRMPERRFNSMADVWSTLGEVS